MNRTFLVFWASYLLVFGFLMGLVTLAVLGAR